MKCPKCGNLIHEQTIQEFTVSNGEPTLVKEQTSIIAVPPELTTAEKLLWLAKNFNIKIDGKFLTKIQIYDGLNNKIVFLEISKDINELIISAYEWAKQREG